jgi:hypothetical protein
MQQQQTFETIDPILFNLPSIWKFLRTTVSGNIDIEYQI